MFLRIRRKKAVITKSLRRTITMGTQGINSMHKELMSSFNEILAFQFDLFHA